VKRRSFLKLLGFAPVAAALPVAARTSFGWKGGFGLAPIKAEGEAIVYDALATKECVAARVFSEALRPGLDKFYSATYADFKPKDLF